MAVRVIVAGGGVSGLSLAYLLQRQGGIDVTVLEADGRTGGKVRTESAGGYLVEWGVNGFLDNKPKTLELARMLALEPLRSSDDARMRFILKGGRLHRLPESPPAFLRSGLISPLGKLRILGEPFVGKRTADDESLADFARRRLGREAFEMFIDPMASGVYAGDPEKLSLKSCFPRIDELEQTYGSLMKAMFSLMRARKKTVGAGPGGTLTSFKGGLQVLTDALTGALGGAVRTKCPVSGVERKGKGYVLHLKSGERLDADAVALAMPAYAASAALEGVDRGAARMVGEIFYPPLSVVALGFRLEQVEASVQAFGYLVPGRERRKLLGTLFDSSIFIGRAPEGRVLLRSMVGGARNPALADQDEHRLVETVLGELRGLLGIGGEPEFGRAYRHERAIPQYNLGHAARVAAVEDALARHPGLYIAGNAFRGVSLNDCVANSFALAEKIAKEVS